MGAKDLIYRSDSQLTIGHTTGEFQVKDPILLKYYHKVQTLLQHFPSIKMEHVRREHNFRADLLSKLASTKKKNHHHSVVQQIVEIPSVTKNEETCGVVEVEECWYEPIRNYLLTGECSDKDLRSMEVKSFGIRWRGTIYIEGGIQDLY